MTKQVPSIGRIVHYYAYGTPGGEYAPDQARAAIVTDVHNPGEPEGVLGLAVFNPTGLFFQRRRLLQPGAERRVLGLAAVRVAPLNLTVPDRDFWT